MLEYVLVCALVAVIAIVYSAVQVYKVWLKRLYELRFGEFPKKRMWLLRLLGFVLAIGTVNIFSIVGIFLLFFFGFFVLFELLRLPFGKHLKEAMAKHRGVKLIANSGLVPLILALLLVLAGYINIRSVVKTEYTVETDKLLSKDYRVLMLSDTHYGTILGEDKLMKLTEEFEKECPDVILLVGDLVDESTTKEEMRTLFRVLGSIKTTYGVYYVYGNHDVQQYSRNPFYTAEELKQAIEDGGITILEDEAISLNEELVLAGHKDYNQNRLEIGEILKEMDTGRFTILMDHQPMEYQRASDAGVDLMVSGHTHGGQIFPLGIFIDLLKTAEQCYGCRQVDDMTAIVSSGASGWGYPIRTERHSEYVMITIKSK